MIRFFCLLLFVLALAVTPVYLFNHAVLPQLNQLQSAYGGAIQAADRVQTGNMAGVAPGSRGAALQSAWPSQSAP